MKQIAIPTDFSRNAWNAIFTVLKLYQGFECRFHILNAYEPKSFDNLGEKNKERLGVLYDSLHEHSERQLSEVSDYLKKNHPNPLHVFEYHSVRDNVTDALQKVMLRTPMDLIAMGTKGATGAKRIFLGSNTVKVLKQVRECPIFVVPDEYDLKALKKIAFATDFTRHFKPHLLDTLADLATYWKAEFEIVHVAVEFLLNDEQKANKVLLQRMLEGHSVRFRNIPFEIDIAKTVQDYLETDDADILAMVQYHHGFWESVIQEPVVKNLAFRSTKPLILLPE